MARSFSGDAEHVSISSPNDFVLGTNRVVSAWVYPTAHPTGESIIIHNGPGTVQDDFWITWDNAGVLSWGFYTTTNLWTQHNVTVTRTLNQWMWVCGTWDGSDLHLWTRTPGADITDRGGLFETRTPYGPSSPICRIGRHVAAANRAFLGRIAEVVCANVAPSIDDLRQLSMGRIPASVRANLALYMPLQGRAVEPDYSGNARNSDSNSSFAVADGPPIGPAFGFDEIDWIYVAALASPAIGIYDADLGGVTLFDADAQSEGWYDRDLIEAAAPSAPQVVLQASGRSAASGSATCAVIRGIRASGSVGASGAAAAGVIRDARAVGGVLAVGAARVGAYRGVQTSGAVGARATALIGAYRGVRGSGAASAAAVANIFVGRPPVDVRASGTSGASGSVRLSVTRAFRAAGTVGTQGSAKLSGIRWIAVAGASGTSGSARASITRALRGTGAAAAAGSAMPNRLRRIATSGGSAAAGTALLIVIPPAAAGPALEALIRVSAKLVALVEATPAHTGIVRIHPTLEADILVNT